MLSRRTRSAIAAVLDIARLARGKPLPAKSLAARYDLPPRQFEAVLQDLVRSGLLKGVRGPRGGYELARERRRITLADVVRAIDAARSADAGPSTADGPDASDPLAPVLAEATAAFMTELDKVTVEDILRRGGDADEETTGADFHI